MYVSLFAEIVVLRVVCVGALASERTAAVGAALEEARAVRVAGARVAAHPHAAGELGAPARLHCTWKTRE